MPTFAKLVSALLFAALTAHVSTMIILQFPEGTDMGYFIQFNAFVGLIIGWIFVGRRAGVGYNTALAIGLTGAALIVFWGLFFQSIGEMIRRSLRKSYDTVPEAVIGTVDLFAGYAHLMSTVEIWTWMLVGGMVIACIVEWVDHRFDH